MTNPPSGDHKWGISCFRAHGPMGPWAMGPGPGLQNHLGSSEGRPHGPMAHGPIGPRQIFWKPVKINCPSATPTNNFQSFWAWFLNSGFWVLASECWLLNHSFWIMVFELWFPKYVFRILVWVLWLPNSGFWFAVCDICFLGPCLRFLIYLTLLYLALLYITLRCFTLLCFAVPCFTLLYITRASTKEVRTPIGKA